MVDLGDAARQLRRRDDLRRRQQRTVRLPHPQQHLVLRLVAARDGDDGLVGKLELPVLQRDARRFVIDFSGHVLGQAVGFQAGLEYGAFDRLQRAAGIGEADR